MYAANGIFLSYWQSFSPDIQDYCKSPESYSSMNNLIPEEFSVSEYDFGGEEDLFKAPEPIMEDQILAIDPMSAAMAMISCNDDDIIFPVGPPIADIECIINDQEFLNEFFYSCKEEPKAKGLIEEETPSSQGLDQKMSGGLIDEDKPIQGECKDGPVSLEWLNNEITLKPDFLDFSMMDFGSVNGMRRAFSEGDIETLGSGGNVKSVDSPLDRLIRNCISEERKEKLSRYRNKKRKRNFGRKIKYACRKVLADNQPRIRGRFAKLQDSDVAKT